MSNQNYEKYYSIRTIADVPKLFQEHPLFNELIKDEAHKGRVNPNTLREAMSAIEAENQKLVKAPISRTKSPYIDFVDSTGYPFDIKAPPSPPRGAKYPFDYYASGNAIIDKLNKTEKNVLTGKEEKIKILLDSSYMTDEDRKILWDFIKKNTNKEQQKRIIEVKIDFGEELKNNKLFSRAVLNKISNSK